MVVADVEGPDIEPFVAVSIYGLIDHGYAITTLHRIFSDLTPLIDSPKGRRLILGGDLNACTQLPRPYRIWHQNFFDRLRSMGLVDLLAETASTRPPLESCPCEDDPCLHVQTHKHQVSRVPWQDDYLFASPELAKSLVRCEPIPGGEPDPWIHSDHLPVVAEFGE